jgi:hypothetical protein
MCSLWYAIVNSTGLVAILSESTQRREAIWSRVERAQPHLGLCNTLPIKIIVDVGQSEQSDRLLN